MLIKSFDKKQLSERLTELSAMQIGFEIAMSGKYKTWEEYAKEMNDAWMKFYDDSVTCLQKNGGLYDKE